MQVRVPPLACGEARDLLVGGIEHDVLAAAEAARGRPFPPGQHRLALVERRAEVHRGVRERAPEPDDLSTVVDDHHPALARSGIRGQEQESVGGVRSAAEHRHERGPQRRSRPEDTNAVAAAVRRTDERLGGECILRPEHPQPTGQQQPSRTGAKHLCAR